MLGAVPWRLLSETEAWGQVLAHRAVLGRVPTRPSPMLLLRVMVEAGTMPGSGRHARSWLAQDSAFECQGWKVRDLGLLGFQMPVPRVRFVAVNEEREPWDWSRRCGSPVTRSQLSAIPSVVRDTKNRPSGLKARLALRSDFPPPWLNVSKSGRPTRRRSAGQRGMVSTSERVV